MFLVEISATTSLSWHPSLRSDVNSGLPQAFHEELCHPPNGVQPILACLPTTGNIGPFYLSLQLLTLTFGFWSVKRKTNKRKSTHCICCMLCYCNTWEKLPVYICISYREHTVFVRIVPGSTTVKHQNSKFHSTLTYHRCKWALLSDHSGNQHPSILWVYYPWSPLISPLINQ